jgi:CheY-like chemotaxis protein
MSASQTPVQLLYVEDETIIQMEVEAVLRHAGFDLVLASNGNQALAMLEGGGSNIQGLITDVRLGEGADGWDVARRAREILPSVSVVYASGGSAKAWFSRGVPLSIMIDKPFLNGQIVKAIYSLLNGPVAA